MTTPSSPTFDLSALELSRLMAGGGELDVALDQVVAGAAARRPADQAFAQASAQIEADADAAIRGQ